MKYSDSRLKKRTFQKLQMGRLRALKQAVCSSRQAIMTTDNDLVTVAETVIESRINIVFCTGKVTDGDFDKFFVDEQQVVNQFTAIGITQRRYRKGSAPEAGQVLQIQSCC